MSSLGIRMARVFTGMHVSLYRASRGRLGGRMGGNRLCLLTTVGRVSGRPRTTPLMTFPQERDEVAVVASNGGSDRPPSWYGNLRANPEVHLQIGADVRAMVARTATAEEKAVIWPRVIASARNFEGYQKKTNRDIPVVILTPAGAAS